MTPGQTVAQRTPQQELIARVRGDEFMQQAEMALSGTGVRPERFVRAAVTALSQNPAIAGADPSSVFLSLLRAAQDGLLPDGYEAALVMFKDKAQYLPMISGYRKVAGEHGWIIRTNIVYEHDHFEYELGFSPTVKHVPVRPGHDPGKAIAAYAVGVHRDGYQELEVMTESEIEKVRRTSRSADKGPWVEWPDRMWEKTVGKRLFKKLPMAQDDRVARLIAVDEMENGEAAEKLYDIQVPALGPDAGGHPLGDHTPSDGGGGDAGDDGLGVGVAPQPPEPEPGGFGDTVVEVGKHAGKTLAQIAAEPKGDSWIGLCLKSDSHPQQKAALEYAREHLPETYQQAMAEYATQGGAA